MAAIKFEFEEEADAEFLLRSLEDCAHFWTKQIKADIAAGRQSTNVVHVANSILLRINYEKDRLWAAFKKQTEEASADGHAG